MVPTDSPTCRYSVRTKRGRNSRGAAANYTMGWAQSPHVEKRHGNARAQGCVRPSDADPSISAPKAQSRILRSFFSLGVLELLYRWCCQALTCCQATSASPSLSCNGEEAVTYNNQHREARESGRVGGRGRATDKHVGENEQHGARSGMGREYRCRCRAWWVYRSTIVDNPA